MLYISFRNLKEELETRQRANQFFAKETEAVQEEMEKHRGELQDISEDETSKESSLPGLIIVMPERRKAVASKRT